jgi:hypothetical protein
VSSSFQSSIERENKTKFFRRNLGYFVGGLVLTALIFAGVLAFGGLPEADLGLLMVMVMAGIFVGMFSIPLTAVISGALRSGSKIRLALILIVVIGVLVHFASVALLLIANAAGQVGSVIASLLIEYPFPFAMVFSFAAVNGLFLYLLKAPTDIGRKVMDQLEGLRLYLDTAESDRLNMQAPEITTERFETLLPYAVALDVEKPWADAFSAALARAHPGDANPMSHYHPTWHSGGGDWSSSSFGRSVASSVTAASTAFSSAMPVSSSSSSGFSGGGGSGGGGGGGGGGGW